MERADRGSDSEHVLFHFGQFAEFLSSHNVVKEVSLASEQRKPVIPVFIEQVDVPQSLQYQLAGLQRVEYSDLHHEDSMQRIAEALAKLGVVPAA